jgi:hypothetical protein
VAAVDGNRTRLTILSPESFIFPRNPTILNMLDTMEVASNLASLKRAPNSPNWIACFMLPDARRTRRSAGAHDRREARRIANPFEDAAQEGKRGRLTEFQTRKVIADIYAISNKDKLASSTIQGSFPKC